MNNPIKMKVNLSVGTFTYHKEKINLSNVDKALELIANNTKDHLVDLTVTEANDRYDGIEDLILKHGFNHYTLMTKELRHVNSPRFDIGDIDVLIGVHELSNINSLKDMDLHKQIHNWKTVVRPNLIEEFKNTPPRKDSLYTVEMVKSHPLYISITN